MSIRGFVIDSCTLFDFVCFYAYVHVLQNKLNNWIRRKVGLSHEKEDTNRGD